MATPTLRPQPIAFCALTLAGALIWLGQGSALRAAAAAPMTAVPTRIGAWTGRPVPMERKVYEILETDDVALMEYTRGKEPPVWLAQVAGFGNRAAFHPPELCFVGSHFEVLERAAITVPVRGRPHRLMRLVVGQGNQHYEAWYWFTANERVTSNYYQQQWWLLLDAIRRRPTAGTLVRISTLLDEPVATRYRLAAFVEQFETSVRQASIHGTH